MTKYKIFRSIFFGFKDEVVFEFVGKEEALDKLHELRIKADAYTAYYLRKV